MPLIEPYERQAPEAGQKSGERLLAAVEGIQSVSCPDRVWWVSFGPVVVCCLQARISFTSRPAADSIFGGFAFLVLLRPDVAVSP